MIRAEGDPTNANCAHCGKQIRAGDKALVYMQPNEDKTANVFKMMVHEQCGPEFFGSGVH